MRRRTLTVAVLAWTVVALLPSVARAAPDVDRPAVDVLLAIDGTASMKSSIAQAKADSERLISRLREVSPDIRVGVAVFRDYRNPAGEYELLQPLTSDADAVEAALDRVRAVSNPDPANGRAESYSLLFRKTYTDAALGWRTGARRVVVVIGDAEPYNAGRESLPGCRSGARDPHGLDPAHELAQMRANRIVLLLVRQVASETSAALACYEALAQLASVGSAARDGGGRSELVQPIVSMMKQIFSPLTIGVSGSRAHRGAKVRYVLTLTNRSSAPMKLAWLQARLPRSFGYDGTSTAGRPKRRVTSHFTLLVWHLNRTVAPDQAVRIGFFARPMRSGGYRVSARGLAALQGDLRVDVDTRASQLLVLR